MSLGTHCDNAAASAVSALYAVKTENLSCRWEIRSLDDSHKLVNSRFRIVDEHENTVDYLAHVVRRNIRRHTDGDTRRAVYEKLREFRRKNGRLL